jgi:hypothetical protein
MEGKGQEEQASEASLDPAEKRQVGPASLPVSWNVEEEGVLGRT